MERKGEANSGWWRLARRCGQERREASSMERKEGGRLEEEEGGAEQ